MLKGLAITPPVIGRISIGRVVERNGKRLTGMTEPGKGILKIIDRLLIEAENLQQAREILRITREKKMTAGVNFQLRYAPAISKARQMLAAGITTVLDSLSLGDYDTAGVRTKMLHAAIGGIDAALVRFAPPMPASRAVVSTSALGSASSRSRAMTSGRVAIAAARSAVPSPSSWLMRTAAISPRSRQPCM